MPRRTNACTGIYPPVEQMPRRTNSWRGQMPGRRNASILFLFIRCLEILFNFLTFFRRTWVVIGSSLSGLSGVFRLNQEIFPENSKQTCSNFSQLLLMGGYQKPFTKSVPKLGTPPPLHILRCFTNLFKKSEVNNVPCSVPNSSDGLIFVKIRALAGRNSSYCDFVVFLWFNARSERCWPVCQAAL